jgi:dUTP pyrophosphatase
MIKITFAPMQEVKIKIVNRSSHPLPEYATVDSAGMDLRANIAEAITLKSLERRLVPTGLYIELPAGFEAQIRPRSGLALRRGLTLLNTPGTVDADYRGEIGVIMVNLSPEAQEIHPGERIAQMVISPYTRAAWQEAEVLSDTERGSGGFGHTGRH